MCSVPRKGRCPLSWGPTFPFSPGSGGLGGKSSRWEGWWWGWRAKLLHQTFSQDSICNLTERCTWWRQLLCLLEFSIKIKLFSASPTTGLHSSKTCQAIYHVSIHYSASSVLILVFFHLLFCLSTFQSFLAFYPLIVFIDILRRHTDKCLLYHMSSELETFLRQ